MADGAEWFARCTKASSMWSIEQTAIGRVVIAPNVPAGYAVFYTTLDFEGRITDDVARQLTDLAAERFGVQATLATCTQVHGVSVQQAPPSGAWRECDSCDALWSDRRNVLLGIKVADCLPIAMVDPANGVAANIHSGWRGAAQRIADATLDALEAATPFRSSEATAWLGPSIRVCCFEVGEEVVERLQTAYGDVTRYVDRSKSRPHVDLAALTRDALRARGFRDERIFDSGLCTRCEGSIFHSFRRAGKGGGRNLAFVAC